MPNLPDIFQNHSEKYHQLVSREDYQHNLIKAINEIIDLEGKEILELGAGTGRLTIQLCHYAKKVHAYEKTSGMFNTAKKNLEQAAFTNYSISVGDNLKGIATEEKFDLGIEGWSFLAAILETPGGFETENALNILNLQIKHLAEHIRKNGRIILIETYGTYVDEPVVRDALIPLYEHLEKELNFQKKIIRTDFQFTSVEEAIELFPFFFGENHRETILINKAVIRAS